MSRKRPSFGQLIRYIHKDADPHFKVLQNVPSSDLRELQAHFAKNYRLLRRRGRWFNSLFHEVISLKRFHGVPLHRYVLALYDVTNRYLSLRGPDLLAYGTLHVKPLHVHVHLMLSSNSLGSPTRHRITPFDFAIMQKKIESYTLTQYPELKQEPILNKGWNKSSPMAQLNQDFDYPLDFI